MKLYRNAVILLVVAALLAGAYLFISNRKQDDQLISESNDTTKIFDLDTAEMTEITIENQDEKLAFVRDIVKEKKGDGSEEERKIWKIKHPEGLKIDESSVNSIAINFSSLTADKVIEENATDFSIYGLDKPTVISVKMNDGSVHTIEIGDMTPTKSAYYARTKDSTKVYTIGSYEGNKIKAGKNDIRDKMVFGLNSEDIIYISMGRQGENIFSAEKSDEYNWAMLSPIQGEADSSAVYPMLEAISQINVNEFIEDSATDLCKYGLDNPSYSLEFKTSTSEGCLLLGAEKEKGKTIYAKLADSNEVFTLSTGNFSFLDKPLKEIVSVFAYIVNIADVKKITVEMDGYTVNCELETDEDDKDNDKFWVDGISVENLKDERDSQYFRKYYQSLIGVVLSDIEIGAVPEGKAEITFTYYLRKSPGTMKVEFVPKDDFYYYVFRNGEYSGILVSRKSFDDPDGVRDTYKKLREAIDKAS